MSASVQFGAKHSLSIAVRWTRSFAMSGILSAVAMACGYPPLPRLAPDDAAPDDAGIDAAIAPELYWVELPQACDASAIRRLRIGDTMPVLVHTVPGPDSIRDLAIDQAGHKIYYSYSGSSANQMDTVERVNQDGTGREPLKTYIKPAPSPIGVAVDPAMGALFWVASAGCSPCPACGACPTIQRTRLDGANEQLVYTISGTVNPAMVEVDAQARKLYWTDYQFAPHIQRVNVDGTAAEPVYTIPSPNVGVGALELVGGKLYWLEQPSFTNGTGAIRRANLDGSSVEPLVVPIGGAQELYPRGLTVDAIGGKLYWTESGFCGAPATGRIRRANLDGSGVETVLDQLGVVDAVRIIRRAN
jgi:hypothetical protein